MRSPGDPAIRLFGTFQYGSAKGPLSGPARRLLVRLLLSPGRLHGRCELAETLWPESDADRRFYLRRALTQLRPVLGEEFRLEAERETLCLSVDHAHVDALTFDSAIRGGDVTGLDRAVELHSAPLLADWSDDWLVPERESRRLAWHRAVETLAAADLEQGRAAEAARRLTIAVAADPLRESSQRLLITALRRAGDRPQAERQYERLEREMRSAFGQAPSAEIREELRRPGPLPTVAAGVEQERYLPVVTTEIVGRDAKRSAVVGMLGTSRLVTLVGTGGIGKTRLALACAEEFAPDAFDLVAMVDLASQESDRSLGDLLARSVKAALRSGCDGEESALLHLESRRTLILLDNCEHVVEAAAELAQAILARCPHVTILATSRQPLGLSEETIFEVPPLGLRCSEVLFAQCAARKGKRLPDSPEAIESVRRICLALDGMPLALGLAAGALRTTGLGELARDIHEVLGADDGARPRHRSLRAAADWSYRLLTPDEARILRSVSPIHGFWTLEYAHAAAGSSSTALDADRSSLRNLVAKSLVGLHEDARGVRYRILEPLRQDAYRRLLAEGEEDAVRLRLRQHVLERSRELAAGNGEGGQAQKLLRAEGEFDAIQCVLQDCLKSPEGCRIGVEIVRSLLALLDYTNRYRDGVFYQERFLAGAEGLDPVQYARGRVQIVHLRANWGEGREILGIGEEAVALAREVGDDDTIGYALCSLAAARYMAGEYALSRQAAEDALGFWTRCEAWVAVAAGSIWAAKAAQAQADWAGAEAHLDRAETIFREQNLIQGFAVLHLNRGRLCFHREAFDAAVGLFRDAESAFVELGDRVHAAAARVGRSACLAHAGKSAEAAELIRSAEESASRLVGDPRSLYDGLGPPDFRERLWSLVSETTASPIPA